MSLTLIIRRCLNQERFSIPLIRCKSTYNKSWKRKPTAKTAYSQNNERKKIKKQNIYDRRNIEVKRSGFNKENNINLETHPESFTGVFQDKNYLIVNKAPGRSVQDDRISLGKTILKPGIISQLLEQDSEIRSVHRLDKNVSGGLLVAKNLISARSFSRHLKLGGNTGYKFIRRYVALIPEGDLLRTQERDYVQFYNNPNKGRITLEDTDKGECVTEFIKYDGVKNDGYQMMLIQLTTGRKHQIRRHLSEAFEKPIRNDNLYGAKSLNNPQDAIGLHSSFIETQVGMTKSQFLIPVRYAHEIWKGFVDEDGNFSKEVNNILINFNDHLKSDLIQLAEKE